MPKPVSLANGRNWSTRTEALAHFKKMLAKYSVGEVISDPLDHNDLEALLRLYDSVLPAGAPTKIGVGVHHFSKERNSGAGCSTEGFHVHHTDGTSDDFSYIDAVRT
jgi:hypothetical protein